MLFCPDYQCLQKNEWLGLFIVTILCLCLSVLKRIIKFQYNQEMVISSHRYRFLWFFILLVILLSPNIYLATTGIEYVSGSIANKVALITFSAFLFLLPLLVVKIRLYLFTMSPLVLLIPLEIIHVNLYGTSSSIGGTGALIYTSISESVEFIDGFKLLIYSAPALFAIFLWIVIAKIKKDFIFTQKFKKSFFYISIIFFSLVFT